MTHTARMAQFEETDLYVVITESFCEGRPALDILAACLDAGVRLVQLREKAMDDLTLFRRAEQFQAHCAAAGAVLIIDDRVDLALAVGAHGVHLGQQDLPIAAARRIAPELIIGASTHSLEEARAAQDAGASYVNIGPIFATGTKAVSSGPVGLEMIDRIRPHLRIPFTCMGGIKEHNIAELVRRGARHAAVVTAVTAAPDVRAAATALRNAMRAAAQ